MNFLTICMMLTIQKTSRPVSHVTVSGKPLEKRENLSYCYSLLCAHSLLELEEDAVRVGDGAGDGSKRIQLEGEGGGEEVSLHELCKFVSFV
jgi:hypothetical protein